MPRRGPRAVREHHALVKQEIDRYLSDPGAMPDLAALYELWRGGREPSAEEERGAP